MTFHENSNQRPPVRNDSYSYMSWIVGAIALLLIAGVMIFAFSNDGTQTANNNTNRPSATGPANPSPPATTGQRSDPVQPTNPAGNTPTAPGSAR
jgi:hypothetical protein